MNRNARFLHFAAAAFSARTLGSWARNLARDIVVAGRKRLLYRDTRFGRRTFVDETCSFEDGVSVGPDSSLFGVRMGRLSYCAFRFWGSDVDIGRFCAIGPNVIAGIGRHPSRDYVSTHPAFYSKAWSETRYAVQAFEEHAPVRIGSDVWIGANVFVASGVSVGDGAVIGTGAVVLKDVAPYEVVGGVPARRIRLRFEPTDVEFLLQLRWWDWPDDLLRERGHLFDDVRRLREAMEQTPKRRSGLPGS